MHENYSMNTSMNNFEFVEYQSQFDEHINESIDVKIFQWILLQTSSHIYYSSNNCF